MPTSLVDSLRPVGRDQIKPTDVLLRATSSSGQTGANGTGILTWDMSGFASFTIQITGDSSSYSVTGSNDLDQWAPLDVRALGKFDVPIATTFMQDNSAPTLLAGNKQTRFVRLSVVSSNARPSGILVLLSQQPFTPMRAARYSEPDQAWSYVAPTGGIVNTTAVTIAAATTSAKRNHVLSLQLANGGSAGTEVALIDSVSTSAIWRGYLPAGSNREVNFDPPLRASAAAAITLAITAATGAQVYPNIQGTLGLA